MAPGFGAGEGPAFRREKAETGVNADVAKLSRKVRLVCHAFMKEAWINRPFAAKPKAAGKPAAFSCSYAEKPVDHSVDRLVGVSFQKRYFRKFSTNRAKLMHIPHVERLLLLRFL